LSLNLVTVFFRFFLAVDFCRFSNSDVCLCLFEATNDNTNS